MTDLTDTFPHLADDDRFFEMPQARRIVRAGDASELAQRIFRAAKQRRQAGEVQSDNS